MKHVNTSEVTVSNIFGYSATYNGEGWYGDKSLVTMLSKQSPDDMQGYQYDPILNYAEHLCSVFTELFISSTKTIEEEYPDNTIF